MKSIRKFVFFLIALYCILLIFKLVFVYRYNQQYVGSYYLPVINIDSISSWLGVFYSILILIGLSYYLYSDRIGFYFLYSILMFYLIDLIYSIVFFDVFLIDTYFYVFFQLFIILLILKNKFLDLRKLRSDKTFIWLTLLVFFSSILFNECLSYWFN
jgi:hypothetical protein